MVRLIVVNVKARRWSVLPLLTAMAVALAACGTTLDGRSAAAGPSATASATGAPAFITCADKERDPIVCSTPPPGWTLPPPLPCEHPLRTVDDIKGAVRPSQAPSPGAWYAQLGQPILVRPLQAGRPDLYLVPHVNPSATTEWVSVVVISSGERGCLGMGGGWNGAFPAVTRDAARQRAESSGDPVAIIEAVYLPFVRSGLPYSSEANFVWRIVHASGVEVFAFGSGEVISGTQVRSVLGLPRSRNCEFATPYGINTGENAAHGYVPDQVEVTFCGNRRLSSDELSRFMTAYSLELVAISSPRDQSQNGYYFRITTGATPPDVVRRVAENPDVRSVGVAPLGRAAGLDGATLRRPAS